MSSKRPSVCPFSPIFQLNDRDARKHSKTTENAGSFRFLFGCFDLENISSMKCGGSDGRFRSNLLVPRTRCIICFNDIQISERKTPRSIFMQIAANSSRYLIVMGRFATEKANVPTARCTNTELK